MITSKWIKPGESLDTVSALRAQSDDAPCADMLDQFSYHLILSLDGTDVATGRIRYLKQDTAALEDIFVLPAFRCQGIGDGLVKILDYKASQLGMHFSEVTCPIALKRFFSLIGFQILASEDGTLQMRKETNDGSTENCKN